MSSNKVTIKDVAKKAGVSIATVSRFMNNPASLKEDSRREVENAVRELKYQPMTYARKLAGGRLNTFGLVIPGFSGIFHSFYAVEIVSGIATALEKERIDLHLNVFWNKDNFNSSLVDGVIFADIVGNMSQLQRIVKEGAPVVVINRKVDDPNVSYVTIDNFKGAYDAVDFLIHHGHKRIAHLAGDMRVQCAQDRVDGYKAALQKNSLPVREEYIKITNFSRKDARDKMEELFKLKETPSAVFCCSDEVASEVLAFAEEKRIEVPKALSVIGFDDNPHCSYGSMMLTTVRQPLDKMTSVSVDTLKEIIEKSISPRKIVLPTELVIRDTVSFL